MFSEAVKEQYGSDTPNENYEFFRKGAVGSSNKELSEDMIKKLNEWETVNLKAAGVSREEFYGV